MDAGKQSTDTGGPALTRNITIKSPFERKTDVFDSEDFEPIKFINQIYPDEASLGDLDSFMAMLRKQIKSVDKEIFQAVRQQSGTQARSRQDLSVASGQIQELFAKVADIQRKAEDTELLVTEICRDIRKLDYAKRHLTHTITSLRRLAMLTAAVNDLEQVAHRRDQYKRCANLLEAVSQLMEHFSQYEGVPKIRQLTKRLTAVQTALQESVLDDFKMLMGSADSKPTAESLERLSGACLIVNALGPKVRDQLMDWLCEREMSVYQTIFSMSADAASLERFERRFGWFKGRLEERKEVWGLFPAAWRVPQTLCLTFCKITKANLKRILSDSEGAFASDVAPLIKTVVATNKFEKEMAVMFGGAGAGDEDDDELQDIDNLPASEARRRLEAFRKRQQAAAAAKAAAATGADAQEAAAAARGAFEGAISEAFEEVLRFYVMEEQRELLAHLDQLLREEAERRWAPAEEDLGASTKVLASANALFLKIRASLQRCVKLVSRGQTLAGLAHAFQRVLSSYANELIKRLPKTAAGATSVPGPYAVGGDWHIRLSEDEEAVVCHILHTAEYCRETIEGLTTAIQKDIKPAFADKVDMSDEEGAFLNVSSQCLSVLVLGLNTRLDGVLADMLRMRWDAIDTPGDDSPYVGALRRCLVEAAPRLGAALDRSHFGFFCDKVARTFVPRYVDAIYRLKKISEKGTLQLSIDTDSVRRALLDFRRLARPLDEEGEAAPYISYVEREMGAATNLVKVLQAKPDNLVDTFILLMPASARTPNDFVRVMELKGFIKKLQSELLVQFHRRVGASTGADPAALAPSTTGSHSSSNTQAPGALPGAVGGAAMAQAASNLSAFKASMNSFTRELASSMSISSNTSGLGSPATSYSSPGSTQVMGSKPTPSGSSAIFGKGAFNMQQTAARTRESLAKVGNFTASILQRPGGADGSGGALGGGGR